MKRILYLVTEDWFFASHFLPMARAARAAGFDVVVAARLSPDAERLRAEGIDVVSYDVERRTLGPIRAIRELVAAVRIIRTQRPDIVHCIALRPVVLGGLAARFAGVRNVVLAPTGLGWLWCETGWSVGFFRRVVRRIVGSWLRTPYTHYLFENRDDPAEFGLDPMSPQVTIVEGAGVDPADFPFVPEPVAPPVKIAVVSRMIHAKGIADAVAAYRRAALATDIPMELHLFGGVDLTDTRAVSEADLHRWASEPGITWHGDTADVARVWREHHVALFLSYYREGLPRTLVEAAAAGRPIVTTDMPGCRDVVRNGEHGILVPPRDVKKAAAALARLAADGALRVRMGSAANQRFQERFTEAHVRHAVGSLYRAMAKDAQSSCKNGGGIAAKERARQ